jgi:hypothetical protein
MIEFAATVQFLLTSEANTAISLQPQHNSGDTTIPGTPQIPGTPTIPGTQQQFRGHCVIDLVTLLLWSCHKGAPKEESDR